jgi:hypothetical protein
MIEITICIFIVIFVYLALDQLLTILWKDD